MTTMISHNPTDGGTYTFASKPQAVRQRQKYRNPYPQQDVEAAKFGNLMHDRRVVRGNTYALRNLPADAQPNPIEIQKKEESRRRAIAKKRAKEQMKPKTPEPVEGRQHIEIQTELYLEELSDRVEEADIEVQTDAFLDRPPSPLFIPAKSGTDVATQILEGDLFDFDIEVKPILEVLVGKTVEQALLEVMEEEELANLRTQQRKFEELRNAELVETQRLEEQERRHREEKQRRIKQQRDVLEKEQETSEKLAARAFAQSYIADLAPSVFGTLRDNGYFFDLIERSVESSFIPHLMSCVDNNLSQAVIARRILNALIRDVTTKRAEQFKKTEEEEAVAAAVAAAMAASSQTQTDLPTVQLEVTTDQPTIEEDGTNERINEENEETDDIRADVINEDDDPEASPRPEEEEEGNDEQQ
ncbi:uncharacterized protein TRIADDRAFT_56411 [Trichoplax adhaerens]|uniref:Uncharacterized protein n=1 Tax=Trichoplax adhaerens TaxID=10228 RepID=B3RY22_TRIAD|nr:hypothetical protein TRIADDRAFT_56411 [Trichoplax adhaerens]EDV24527.1 hypothetical protein TRIADDRAFT_56411 [Trichoplax adhaerens]|eukprot:XP_002112417.1 hypothetical protein TRIADDRAFT_56411 [Trichoplax adhaerens]